MKNNKSLSLPFELERIRLQLVGAIELIDANKTGYTLNPACAVIDAAVCKLIEIEKQIIAKRDTKAPKKSIPRKAKESRPTVQ